VLDADKGIYTCTGVIISTITFQRYLLSHPIIEDTQERAPLMLAEFNVNCTLTIIYTGQTHAQVVPSLWVSTYRQMLSVSIPLIETDLVIFRDRTPRAYNHDVTRQCSTGDASDNSFGGRSRTWQP
jgi:hypothetical protein